MSTYIKLNMLGQPSAVQYETIPDEDLWEDGELDSEQVKEKLYQEIIRQGEWKIIREKE